MKTQRTCPKCGVALPTDAPEGLCPECLLQQGFGTRSGGTSPDDIERTTAPHCAVPKPLSPEELAPHFPQLEILELLGQGGMGIVYKARQRNLDRLVALKILSQEAGHDPAFEERFSREARALAKLNHPNIVAIHDFGRAGGFCYFIMEFVEGVNLRQLEQARRLTPTEALSLVPKICEALQYAHDEGFVHRDIKPGNILIDKRGRVKIADFGLAKLLGRPATDLTLTASQQVMGTPQYMAPEQMERPQEVDHRADIYSLGVVFYEMLTGDLPLGRFAPPSQKVQVDVRLDEVVLKSLENKPERRYQHASEVKTDLEAIGGSPPNLSPGARAVSSRTEPKADWDTYPFIRLALWGIGTLMGLLVLWIGFLQLKVMQSNRLLHGAEAEWARLEKQIAPIKTNLMKIAEIEQKRAALNAYATNRFVWSELLNALQLCMVENIEVTDIQAEQDYALTPAQSDPRTNHVLTPATSTETIRLMIRGNDFTPVKSGINSDYACWKFIEAIGKNPYFQVHLRQPAPVRLISLGQPSPAPDNQRIRRAFIIECQFPAKVRP